MSKERFLSELWPLNPIGSENMTYEYIKEKELDLDMIIQKYKDYKHHWDVLYGQRDAKFIGKNDKLRTIYSFLVDKLYNNDYKNPNSLREDYLFGGLTYDQLKEKHKQFTDELRSSISN